MSQPVYPAITDGAPNAALPDRNCSGSLILTDVVLHWHRPGHPFGIRLIALGGLLVFISLLSRRHLGLFLSSLFHHFLLTPP